MTQRRALIVFTALFATACAPRSGTQASPPVVASGHDAPVAPLSGPVPVAAAPVAVDAGGALRVTPTPQFTAVLPAAGELNILLRLEGAESPEMERPPLDLALVLDRSGSMAGDKILAVRSASLDLLSRLGPDDRLTLITYSSQVERRIEHLPMDAAGKALARAQVLDTHASGMTALGPAMHAAYEILRGRPTAEGRIAHVLFMSDGLANVGERDPQVLGQWAAASQREGVSLSSIGVGLDYNEDLMTAIADQGGGRYHFVGDESQVGAILGDELAGLVATVASQVAVELIPADGVRVLRVFGYPVDEEDGRVMIRAGDVASGRSREIVVRLGIDRPLGADGAEAALGPIRVTYRDMLADGAAKALSTDLRVSVVDDEGAIAATENHEVTVRVAEVEAADRLTTAARAVDAGDFGAAEQVLQESLDDLRARQARKPSPRLNAQIQKLEEASGGLGAARASSTARKEYVKGQKATGYSLQKR